MFFIRFNWILWFIQLFISGSIDIWCISLFVYIILIFLLSYVWYMFFSTVSHITVCINLFALLSKCHKPSSLLLLIFNNFLSIWEIVPRWWIIYICSGTKRTLYRISESILLLLIFIKLPCLNHIHLILDSCLRSLVWTWPWYFCFPSI